MNDNLMNYFSYGMYLLSSKNCGCIINTACQITSDVNNLIITVSVNKNNYTNEIIKKTKKLALSILSQDTDLELIKTFGFKSGTDKFNNYNYETIDDCNVLTDNIIGYLTADVIDTIDCDTHDIVIAKVNKQKVLNEENPLTYKYYKEVLKGAVNKNAPTYNKLDTDKLEKKTTASGQEVWICTICGYVHEGSLPEDFICPRCGVERKYFVKK